MQAQHNHDEINEMTRLPIPGVYSTSDRRFRKSDLIIRVHSRAQLHSLTAKGMKFAILLKLDSENRCREQTIRLPGKFDERRKVKILCPDNAR